MKMSRESSNQREQEDPLSFKLELGQKEVETITSSWDIQKRQLFLEELELCKRVLIDNKKSNLKIRC